MDAVDLAKQRKTERGLNQVQLAELCGVSPAAVSRWLKRKRRPGGRGAVALRNVLGIDPAAWLDVVLVTDKPPQDEAA